MIYQIAKSFTILDFLSLALIILLLLVCLVGSVIALIRWKAHRAVSVISMLAALGTALGSAGIFILWIYLFEVRTDEILGDGGSDRFLEIAISQRMASSQMIFALSLLQVIMVPLFFLGMFLGRRKT